MATEKQEYKLVVWKPFAEMEREVTIEFLRLINENAQMADLIKAAVKFFQQRSSCQAVGIRFNRGDDFPYYEARGFPEDFLLLENHLCSRDAAGNVCRDSNGNPLLECLCGKVICGRFDPKKSFFTNGGSFWTNNTTHLLATTTEEDLQTHTRNRCNGEGYESVALVPLSLGTQRIGLLQLNDQREGMFTPEHIALWERLAGYLSVALVRAQVEEKLRESERLLKRAQEIAHLGSWELDLVTNKLSWSDEVFRIFGLVPQEFGATYEEFLAHVHPDDRAAVDAAYTGSVNEGKDSYEIVHRVVKQNTGEIRWVHERCQHTRDIGGRITRSEGMVLDITDRKHTEEALRTSNAELSRSNSELGQFTYLASHDLQEPLRMVVTFAELLRESLHENLGEKTAQYLAFLTEGAQRIRALVDALLSYSSVTGQAKDCVPTRAQRALDLALANLHSIITESGAKVTVDSMPIVLADNSQLVQIFENLVGNAIKFRRPEVTPEIHVGAKKVVSSGPESSASRTSTPSTSISWLFSVRDNGIGIDSRYFDKIFQIFHRLHKREKYPGTGIGLALCKKIVERHGGRIWFESKPGKGTTVFFTLPGTSEQTPLR